MEQNEILDLVKKCSDANVGIMGVGIRRLEQD